MSPAEVLDLLSVFVFALTGGLVASRAQLDVVGFLFLACLTGVGGGTLRDLLLGRAPVFWVGSPHYIAVACAAAILAFIAAPRLEFALPGDPLARRAGAVGRRRGRCVDRTRGRGVVADRPHHGSGHRHLRRTDARRRRQRDPDAAAKGRALRQRLSLRRPCERCFRRRIPGARGAVAAARRRDHIPSPWRVAAFRVELASLSAAPARKRPRVRVEVEAHAVRHRSRGTEDTAGVTAPSRSALAAIRLHGRAPRSS